MEWGQDKRRKKSTKVNTKVRRMNRRNSMTTLSWQWKCLQKQLVSPSWIQELKRNQRKLQLNNLMISSKIWLWTQRDLISSWKCLSKNKIELWMRLLRKTTMLSIKANKCPSNNMKMNKLKHAEKRKIWSKLLQCQRQWLKLIELRWVRRNISYNWLLRDRVSKLRLWLLSRRRMMP